MGTTTVERDVKRLGNELYNGIDKGSTAFKLLASMGWKEGDGLVSAQPGLACGGAAPDASTQFGHAGQGAHAASLAPPRRAPSGRVSRSI